MRLATIDITYEALASLLGCPDETIVTSVKDVWDRRAISVMITHEGLPRVPEGGKPIKVETINGMFVEGGSITSIDIDSFEAYQRRKTTWMTVENILTVARDIRKSYKEDVDIKPCIDLLDYLLSKLDE